MRNDAVVAAPHAELGEMPVLLVAENPGERLDVPALLAVCRRRLSADKAPHAAQPMEEIPRAGSGKMMCLRLKALPRP